MTARLAAILVLILRAGMDCLAQDQLRPREPVLRVETTAVVVDVIVTDRKGHHVEGLSVGDFKLYEDNAAQAIATFTPPVARAERHQMSDGRPVPTVNTPTPSTPEEPSKQTRAAQLITLVIDLGDLHPDSLKRAYAAATKFAEKTIAAGNLIAIYWVDTSLHLGLPFTRDWKRALEVLENLNARLPSGRFSVLERERTLDELDEMKHDSVVLATNPGAGSPPPDPMAHARDMLRSWITTANALQARTVFVALRAMALAYRDLPGRKSVVVFSEGFLHALDGGPEIEAVIDAANRANVAIYVIDASGITENDPDGKNPMSVKRQTYDPQVGADIGEGRGGRVAGGLGQFDLVQTLGSDRRGDLGAIASATGGLLIKDTNDLGPALDRVEDDASEFYTLVYSPSNANYDGAFRKIKVELVERGYHVRYRQGYWAIPPGRAIMMTPAATQLLATVESGERKPSFAPQVNAVLVPASDGHFGLSAAVSMPGKLVRFDKLKDQYVAGVSVLLIARDARGQLLAVHERYGDVRLKPKERQEFSSRTFNMQGNVLVSELQPVSVQAIVRFADGTLGVSERKNIDPTQGSSNLRLTSLVLSDRDQNTPCSPNPVEPLCVQGARLLLPAEPQFSRSATLAVYFSVLGVSLDAAQKPHLGVSFRLRSGDTMNPFKPKQLLATPGNLPNAYLVMAAFDLQALQPGKYRLEMTAEDSTQPARATESTELTIQ